MEPTLLCHFERHNHRKDSKNLQRQVKAKSGIYYTGTQWLAQNYEDDVAAVVKWAVIGKVLSTATLHITTIRNAMKPAWGNPFGLKFHSVGEKSENLFIADFGSSDDKKRALEGSPWMVGRHAVVLQEYDASLKPSDVSFAKMEMWVRILNLPFGWMNERRGSRAASLVGEVVRMDVDGDGEASGSFLRARVLVDMDKPLRRGPRSHAETGQVLQTGMVRVAI